MAPILALISLSSCGGFPQHPLEKDLGVDGAITSQYNNLALNPTTARLAFDGYIIGIEKLEKIEKEPSQHPSHQEPYAQIINRIEDVARCPIIWPPIGSIGEERGRLCHYQEKAFGQVKTMAVTHIAAFQPSEPSVHYLHNIYASSKDLEGCEDHHASESPKDAVAEYCHLKELVRDAEGNTHHTSISNTDYFMDGILAIKQTLRTELSAKLRRDSDRYTHLVLASAGWDNDQEVSIAHYNAVLSNIQQAASDEGRDFRPLFIGLTWPSVWGNDDWVLGLKHYFMKFVGYPNKANDADEIGYTIMNVLLNEVIADIKAGSDYGGMPVVVFGHSFGGRLTSRAVYSAHHLKDKRDYENPTVDVFVGLQPAFSISRFMKDSGREGAPYLQKNAPGVPVVLTTSEHDTANPSARLATGARHVGGKYGLKAAKAYELGGRSADHRFVLFKGAGANGRIDGACEEWRQIHDRNPNAVFVVDAKRFVRSHGDVDDLPAGRMIWDSIDCFTEPQTAT